MGPLRLPPPAISLALGTALGLSLAYLLRAYRLNSSPSPPSPIPAPTPTPSSSSSPYPPSAVPGGRRVPTPHGTIQVYEFGPATGEKVLFLPGISTPVLALGDLAGNLAERGYRVMLFDLFGRGYSDAPGGDGVVYDERLYVAQVLLVLASSRLAWTGERAFHLVGYSLGGGLAVSFARWCGPMVRSLVCVAGAGLVRRREHVGWRNRVLYSSGWLPERLLEWLVERRIRPERKGGGRADEVDAEGTGRDSDANGGTGWDSTLLSKRRGGGTTVADVMEWQIREHKGFVSAFISSIRHAPIYDRREDWAALGRLLEERRKDPGLAGSRHGKVLLVLGKRDSVIVKDELVEDATALLGVDGVEVVEIDAGHELAFTHGDEVADAAVSFWSGDVSGGSSWVVSAQAGTEDQTST